MLADGGGRVKAKNAIRKRNWHYMPPPPPQPPLLPTHACSWPVLDPFPTSNGQLRADFGAVSNARQLCLSSASLPTLQKWRSWVKTGVPVPGRA